MSSQKPTRLAHDKAREHQEDNETPEESVEEEVAEKFVINLGNVHKTGPNSSLNVPRKRTGPHPEQPSRSGPSPNVPMVLVWTNMKTTNLEEKEKLVIWNILKVVEKDTTETKLDQGTREAPKQDKISDNFANDDGTKEAKQIVANPKASQSQGSFHPKDVIKTQTKPEDITDAQDVANSNCQFLEAKVEKFEAEVVLEGQETQQQAKMFWTRRRRSTHTWKKTMFMPCQFPKKTMFMSWHPKKTMFMPWQITPKILNLLEVYLPEVSF